MNEASLLSLIGEGEKVNVDFKQELDLSKSKNKAEFVKDVIAIANSSPKKGFLLIGVADDKRIVGVSLIPEERIQQIAQTYINPPVAIRCDNVPLAHSGFLNVGIIEINATARPHKVSRDVDTLKQNDVFIRRGTTISKASPEEIIQMHGEDRELNQLSVQYIQAAETHMKLKNYEAAINAYSKVIEISPSAELFLARAKAYLLHSKNRMYGNSDAQVRFTKDLTDAISLTNSYELEKEARLLRYRKGGGEIYYKTLHDADFKWIQSSYEGLARAEFIFAEVSDREMYFMRPEKAVPLLEEVIELGLENAIIYRDMSEAYFLMFNYGLALKAIEKAAQIVKEYETDLKSQILIYKGTILFRMEEFRQARQCFAQAEKIQSSNHQHKNTSPVTNQFYTPYPQSKTILLGYSLAQEFGEDIGFADKIALRSLIFNLARSLVSIETEDETSKKVISLRTKLESFEEEYPGIKDIFREIVGEDGWQAIRRDKNLAMRVTFPTISELLPDDYFLE